MSYTERGSWTQGWKLVLGIIIAFVVISVLLGKSPPPGPREVAAQLEANPQNRETDGALREYYPREHEQLVERLSAALQRGGNSATAEADGSGFMRELLRGKAYAIISAPDAELREIAQADLAVARSLQRGAVELCADFMGSGIAPGAHPPTEVMSLLDHAMALRLRAAHQGEISRRPPRASLSPADARAWLARLNANDPASAALIRAGQSERAPPAQQCTTGIAVYQAALDLPEAQSGQVIASLFQTALAG